jgi:hypothetical protein
MSIASSLGDQQAWRSWRKVVLLTEVNSWRIADRSVALKKRKDWAKDWKQDDSQVLSSLGD